MAAGVLLVWCGTALPARAHEETALNEETALIEARTLAVPMIDARILGGSPADAAPALAAAAAGDTGLAAGVCAAQEGRLPPSVRVDAPLHARIQTMLERSSTFRQQCRRLAMAPWMHVAVRLGPYFMDRQGYRAFSTIQKVQPRLLIAIVTLQASADPAPWMGHEFEHLIEQLEQVDVQRQAVTLRDAWHTRQGMIETGRAIRAGMRVLDEVRGAASQDNLVE